MKKSRLDAFNTYNSMWHGTVTVTGDKYDIIIICGRRRSMTNANTTKIINSRAVVARGACYFFATAAHAACVRCYRDAADRPTERREWTINQFDGYAQRTMAQHPADETGGRRRHTITK